MLYTCNGHSAVLKTYVTYYVIIPSFYQGDTKGAALDVIYPEKRKELPVLYLLHGGVADASCWIRFTEIEALAEEYGIAVVMPNVGNSYYTDMVHGPAYYTFVAEELPRMIRCVFPISGKREDNYAAGLSMGGYGALKLAMGNPDRYKGAVSLSGVVDIMDLLNCGLYEELLDLDSIYGKEREKVKGSGDDIYFLTQKIADERKEIPRVYLAVGKDDYFAKTNQAYAQMIGQLGIDYHFDLDEGGHDWNFWNPHLKSGLEWMLNG